LGIGEGLLCGYTRIAFYFLPKTFLKNSRLALLASCFERRSDSISCGVKGLGPDEKSGLGFGECGLLSSRASWVGSGMVMRTPDEGCHHHL
jgi:hypothetical protein